VRKHEQIGLDFEVDKLTDSIQNVVSGDSFATDITIISISDLKTDTLGAIHFGGRVMIIDTNSALKLINKYFP